MKKFLSFFLYFAFVVCSFFCPSNLFSFSIEEDIFNYVKITDSDININTPTLYERLLLAAARDPRKIQSIRDVMTRVSEDKIDPEFQELIRCFEHFVEE